MTGGFECGRAHPGRLVLTACVLFTLLLPCSLLGQQDERSVRAAFVFNLTKYVTWPTSGRELNICVLGAGATGPALKLVVDGKISEGKTLHVLLGPSDRELRQCEIIYCSGPFAAGVGSILDKTRGTSILTIGEDDKFVREGGMIGFVRSGDSIQIEVNLDSLKSGGLRVNSRLLDLALIIHAGRRG